MPNYYCSLEQVKRAVHIDGATQDSILMRIIEAQSRAIDTATRRWFIPRTETRLYRWPSRTGQGTVLWVDADLLSITTLKSEAQNSSPTTIAATDYFLEPNNMPPYNRIEIDLSSNAAFQSGDTPQRSISVLGSWGYDDDTLAAGTVSSGLDSDATATTMVCSDASKIDVGTTLLIQSEQVFVADRRFAALGNILVNDTDITADKADVSITLDSSHGVLANEVIRLDSEQLYVVGVATNVITVIRAYNGSVLATHADNTAVHINRTLTIERGVNGTTAATHANAVAMSKYVVEPEISDWCLDESIADYAQKGAAWGRMVGTGEGAFEYRGASLARKVALLTARYRRMRSAAI